MEVVVARKGSSPGGFLTEWDAYCKREFTYVCWVAWLRWDFLNLFGVKGGLGKKSV
jgi:hypothetical protein